MMTPFFVTGLPRSRTAWCAVWLTNGTRICRHDRFAPFTGGSGYAGPELVFDYPQLKRDFPDAPWLVIERRPDEAYEAFLKAARHHLPPDGPALRQVWKGRLMAYGAVLAGVRTLKVNMGELDNLDTAKAIWSHLLPGVEFDGHEQARWEQLRRLNIQQKIDQCLKEITESWQPEALLAQ